MDPRKPILTPTGESRDQVIQMAHEVLLDATFVGAKVLGCPGASFVTIGMGIWAMELSELDAKATSQMLSALATLYDPKSNHGQKMRAEKRRAAAVKQILSALDLEMATPAGTTQ